METTISYGSGDRIYDYPSWATALVWTISLLPLTFIPALAGYQIYKNFQMKKVGLSSFSSICFFLF